MIVVCDTSPICYLVLIGEVGILPELFGEIDIAQGVLDELTAGGSPAALDDWTRDFPPWLRLHPSPETAASLPPGLHRGESESLALARALGAHLLIVDDKAARTTAQSLGLRFTGLLGVLDRAATLGMIELFPAVSRLRDTSFRIAPSLLRQLLQRHLDS